MIDGWLFETEKKGKHSIVLPCCYAFFNQTNRNFSFFSFSFQCDVIYWGRNCFETGFTPFFLSELECEFDLTKNIRELSSLNVLDLANIFSYAESRMTVCSLGLLLRYVQNIWINEVWINRVWLFTHTLKKTWKADTPTKTWNN